MILTPESTEKLCRVHQQVDDGLSIYACKETMAIREHPSTRYENDVIRTNFSRDIDGILHSVLYNRGADKTQVFSFYRNDDITRRASHMQYVSRISRVIGKALNLNLELIEAIAIGHDVGHTPFGHKGEDFLSELYNANTGRFFNHNVHSVRVLQLITNCNLTLQTLDGILCHNGEKLFEHYEPNTSMGFDEFYKNFNNCYKEKNFVKTLKPCTMEGCVVRISDVIAYIGKDRQDATKAKLPSLAQLNGRTKPLGERNSDIITTLVIDIINNSIDKNYIALSPNIFTALKQISDDNNECIYQCNEIVVPYFKVIKPMMEKLYKQCLKDLINNNYDSPIYQHYLNGSVVGNYYRTRSKGAWIDLDKHDENDIVVDFIASMTDDYFIDCFEYLFPDDPLNKEIQFIGYFDQRYLKRK